MRLKRQMAVSRIVGINRKIDNISAKIELAEHNVLLYGRKMENQQALVTEIGEDQDVEEEAIEELVWQLNKMKKERREKEPRRNWLKTLWKSKVLNEIPGTRKNLLKRTNLDGKRPEFGKLDLPIGEGTEESRREEEEQKQLQEEMEEELETRQEREQDLLESFQEEEITLKCMQEIFFQDHSPQLMGLIELRDKDILRREMIARDFY